MNQLEISAMCELVKNSLATEPKGESMEYRYSNFKEFFNEAIDAMLSFTTTDDAETLANVLKQYHITNTAHGIKIEFPCLGTTQDR